MKTEQEIRDRIAFIQGKLNHNLEVIKNPASDNQKEIHKQLSMQKIMTINHLKWVIDDHS